MGSWALTSNSGTPTGAAGGDLGGTFPSPSVLKIRGTAVSATPPSAGQVLELTGGVYTPTTIAAGTNGVFDVTTFGAKGDGVTDDTVAINAAIAAALAAGGGAGDAIVYFPPAAAANYKVSAALTAATVPLRFVGSDEGVTITYSQTTGAVFTFSAGGVPACELVNLSVLPSGTPTAGEALSVTTGNAIVRACVLTGFAAVSMAGGGLSAYDSQLTGRSGPALALATAGAVLLANTIIFNFTAPGGCIGITGAATILMLGGRLVPSASGTCVDVNAAAVVNLVGVTIVVRGGVGVFVEHAGAFVTLADCNVANSADGGEAILQTAASTVRISDSQFVSTDANGTVGIDGQGGTIVVSGTLVTGYANGWKNTSGTFIDGGGNTLSGNTTEFTGSPSAAFIGNVIAGGSVEGVLVSTVGLVTAPAASASFAAAISAGVQNTNAFDILVSGAIDYTGAVAGATLTLGVGPTSAPSQQTFATIVLAGTGQAYFSAVVAAGYFLGLGSTGTITPGTVNAVGTPL